MSPFNTTDPSKLTRLTQDRHQLRPFCDHQWCHHLSDNATVQPAFATSCGELNKVFKRHKWRHQSPSLPATPSLYIYKLTRRKEVNCLGPALQSTFAWFLSWNTKLWPFEVTILQKELKFMTESLFLKCHPSSCSIVLHPSPPLTSLDTSVWLYLLVLIGTLWQPLC